MLGATCYEKWTRITVPFSNVATIEKSAPEFTLACMWRPGRHIYAAYMWRPEVKTWFIDNLEITIPDRMLGLFRHSSVICIGIGGDHHVIFKFKNPDDALHFKIIWS